MDDNHESKKSEFCRKCNLTHTSSSVLENGIVKLLLNCNVHDRYFVVEFDTKKASFKEALAELDLKVQV